MTSAERLNEVARLLELPLEPLKEGYLAGQFTEMVSTILLKLATTPKVIVHHDTGWVRSRPGE